MLLSFDDLLNQKADTKTFILAGLAVIGALIGIFLFIQITRVCFTMERQTGKPAHTLIKTVLVAAAPTIFTVLALLKIDVPVPFSVFIGISVVMFIIVAIWNIKTYGILGGLFFSLVHGVFGVLASLGVGMLVFVGIFLIIAIFFGGSSGSVTGGSSGNSAPSSVRNIRTGQVHTVSSGMNGNLYLADNNYVLYPDPDFQGKYYDDHGNDYEPA